MKANIEEAIKKEFNMIWTYSQFDVYMPKLLNAFKEWQSQQQPEIPEGEKLDKWYDFLSGKGEIAADIACFITAQTKAALQQKPNNDLPEQQGKELFEWVKASEEKPEAWKDVIVRNIETGRVIVTKDMHHRNGWDIAADYLFQWDNTEWLKPVKAKEQKGMF